MIQQILATWSLVSLPFLKLAWTSESSRFMYCWSLGVVRGKNVSKTTLFLHTSTVQGYFWRIMQSCIRSEWWEFEQLMWNLTSALTEFCCCYCSVAKSCPTLWDPMNCSTPGFPVLHYLCVCSNSCPLSQVVLVVKNLAANGRDARCQEDPLEEGMATHSSILAWRIPVDRGDWQATVHHEESDTTKPLSTAHHLC